MKKIKVDLLSVEIFDSRKEMGEAAAKDICERINSLLKTKSHLNMIFAAAPSQNEVLESLTKMDVDWTKISAFHMDEYIGLDPKAPQGFGNFLRTRIFEKLPFGSVNYINPSAKDPYEEAKRYGDLLSNNPVDIVVMGIGENGHIAFNDPPVADFSDPLVAKVVPLDQTCRMQQVHDGCFGSIDEVPTHAITLTVPTPSWSSPMMKQRAAFAWPSSQLLRLSNSARSTTCPCVMADVVKERAYLSSVEAPVFGV